MMTSIIYLQQLTTLLLTGLIWFVQVVHYPLFTSVKQSTPYYIRHQFRTSILVIPLMLTEFICASTLAYLTPSWLSLLALGILIVIWLSTFLFQVPCHLKLKHKYREETANRLVHSNWIRTVGWSVRAIIVIVFPYA